MTSEQMEEIKRHFGVVAEPLRSDIRQIAEGHATIRYELQDHRREVRDEFKEMRAQSFPPQFMSCNPTNPLESSGPRTPAVRSSAVRE